MFKRTRVATAAAIALATMLSHAQAQDTADATPAEATIDTVVATVNGTDITLGSLIAMRASLPEQYDQLPPDVLFNGLLEQVIQQAVLAQTLDESSMMVKLQVENQERSLKATEAMTSRLEGAVSEEEIQAIYDEEYGNLDPVTEWNASHILVETEDEAKALVTELEGGADFAELAQEKSTGPSGPNGGELGWFGPGMMVEPFEEAVKTLAVGDISGPVQTQFGWHVLKLNDMRDQPIPTLDEVRGDITQRLQEQKITEIVDNLTAEADIVRPDLSAISPDILNNRDLLQ